MHLQDETGKVFGLSSHRLYIGVEGIAAKILKIFVAGAEFGNVGGWFLLLSCCSAHCNGRSL